MKYSAIKKIEFVGLPGAGKSTVAEQVKASLVARGCPCIDRPAYHRIVGADHALQNPVARKLRYLAYLLKERETVGLGLLFAGAQRPPKLAGLRRYYYLTRKLHNTGLLGELIDMPDHVILLDQDLLQEIWGVLYLRPMIGESRLDVYLRAIQDDLPDVIVYVEVSSELAIERMARRREEIGSTGEFDGWTSLDSQRLERSAQDFDRIIEAVSGLRNTMVVRVDGALSTLEQSRIIVDALEAGPAQKRQAS